ncbi:unnamed protein product [Durusdinium trenchii]|uniref:Nudix hydrolase domain-containing protein n=1 Tax=Durusdinium trenchii TaxID=1381693 RepID=A0ABP0RCP2_9DINO
MLLCGHPCSRPAFLEPCSVRVASPAESLRFRAWQGLKWAAGAALVGWGVLRLYERRPRRRRSSVVRGAAIPEDFRAAGVIFYTMNAQELGKLLLAVEERRVPLRELGLGSGSAQKRVLLFPQGKREPEDEDYVATARREFVEETADFGDLARHLKGPLEAIWYIAAKMAVVFCEVPASVVEESEEARSSQAAAPAKPAPRPRRQQARQQEKDAQKKKALPLQPVWVDASDLRIALGSSAGEVETQIGRYHLFPVSRKFFQIGEVSRWLGLVAPSRHRGVAAR